LTLYFIRFIEILKRNEEEKLKKEGKCYFLTAFSNIGLQRNYD